MNLEGYLTLLVKLAAMAAIASIVARSTTFQAMLMRETRTVSQRASLALWLGVVFATSVAVRIAGPQTAYQAADLGLEGSLIAGLLGGYVTGLLSGILISLPSFFKHEYLTLPLLASVGVLGGLLRDLAPNPEEVWRFSPYPDINIYRFFKEKRDHWRTGFQLVFFAAILCAEALRQGLGELFRHGANGGSLVFCLKPPPSAEPGHSLAIAATYATTLFAVAIPLKIWNNTRNEKKLEEQARLLVEARLAALTSQINPHFLFNTLNSVSSLIRTNPNQARVMVVKLSKVLRRLLRKHENFSPLRDELNFIEDYLSIEVIRFGDKLKFETDVAADTLDMLLPTMVLQPLVENCIKHGLRSKVEGGTIRIRTQRSGSRLHLQVEDDGVGIPEEKLGTLLEHGGIGVSNVNERLKVLFGAEYRMWIESQPGSGTRVQIEVPELEPDLAAVS
ncbi:MAG TPA: sensor histidine kinase [Bryobacteraceae bacterium]|jgi:two-component system LytT family sensor kinase|nr:sensor histidine kinase [Bryobacteraceae bacterium]